MMASRQTLIKLKLSFPFHLVRQIENTSVLEIQSRPRQQWEIVVFPTNQASTQAIDCAQNFLPRWINEKAENATQQNITIDNRD